mgnify:CR=1 FL=1
MKIGLKTKKLGRHWIPWLHIQMSSGNIRLLFTTFATEIKRILKKRFALFLNKLLMELMTKYLMTPTINAVKLDILKLNSAIVVSIVPAFEFKVIDMPQLEPYIQNPNRNTVRMLLKTLAYEHQDDLLPAMGD